MKKVQSNTRRKGSNAKQKKFKKKTDRHNVSTIKKSRYTIVRVIGHGQFRVDNGTAKKISKIDNELIKIIELRKQGEKKYLSNSVRSAGIGKKKGASA